MRLRTTVAAALGALALVVTLPTSASATVGFFAYSYTGLDGTPQIAELINPPSGECVTLPEVADPNSSNPARLSLELHRLDRHRLHRPRL